MLRNGPQSLGPKWSKMVPTVFDFDYLGGLGPKCFKMVPKVVDFDHLGGNGPKWSKMVAKPNGQSRNLS